MGGVAGERPCRDALTPLTPDPPLTRVGRNLWRRCRSRRAAVLVDTAAYFEAFIRACEKAERSILIVGWDLDSRVELRPASASGSIPTVLGEFLGALVRRRPGLQVHVLGWDYSLLFAMEREFMPSLGFGWRTPPAVHFALDDHHPFGASHHQKVAVVDDAVAFAGGIDLCSNRWDTPAHAPGDPGRVTPDGDPYGPFHDVQMVVDGETAAALGELVRERWRRSGRGAVSAPAAPSGDPWPDGVAPDFTDVEVGIARTEPAYDGRPAVAEVSALTEDLIAGARRWLYVENQYLTSRIVRDLLCARLGEEDPPEMLVVAPRIASGWLERTTMGALRARLVTRLRECDRRGRLRVCCPKVPALGTQCLNVHAKVMVVDDRVLRVGSANLSNRSMGLDTECDLVIEARDEREAAAIAAVRWRLMGEHLGADPSSLAESARELGSLFAVVDRHRGERTLEELEVDPSEALEEVVANGKLVDPDGPIDGDLVLETLVPEEQRRRSRRRILRGVGLVVAAFALGALWAFTPLRSLLDPAALGHAMAPLRASPWAPLAVLAIFVLAGLVSYPVTLLIVQCAWVFGPWRGLAYSTVGVVASAAATWALGRAMGRGRVRRFAGPRLGWLVERLRRRGVLAVALVRTFPVAPFSVVNLLAGAAHVGLGSFLLGTVLGMAPGILALTGFGSSLSVAIRRRDPASLTVALAALIALVAAGALFRRWLRRRGRSVPA